MAVVPPFDASFASSVLSSTLARAELFSACASAASEMASCLLEMSLKTSIRA